MTSNVSPHLASDHHEAEERPTLRTVPAQTTPVEPDARYFDPTQGRQLGSHPYDDPTQGRKIGSEANDDPTRVR